MHRAECFNLGLAWHAPQVTQVCHGHAFVIENVQGIARFIRIILPKPIGLDAGDKYTTNLKLTWRVDQVRISLQPQKYCYVLVLHG